MALDLVSVFDYVLQLPLGAIIILVGIGCIIVSILGHIPPRGKELGKIPRVLLSIFGAILILSVILANVKADDPPEVVALTSYPHSPVIIGTDVTWTASAIDPDTFSPIKYRFWLNGVSNENNWISEKGWGLVNNWTWKTASMKPGTYQIKVEVIDGKHAGSDGNDSFMIEDYPLSEIKVTNPNQGSNVAYYIRVDGTISGGLPIGQYMWILVNPRALPNQWWPQGGRPVNPTKGQWSGEATLGGGPDKDIGNEFDIAVVLVNEIDNERLKNWVIETNKDRNYYSISLPESANIVDQVTIMRIPG